MLSPQTLLPHEPRVPNWERQQALTERHLQPQLEAISGLMNGIRLDVNPQLQACQPIKWGKAYPLGQCLEISLAVKRRLRELDPATLPAQAAQGHAALAAFLAAGGDMHQVWGDLRGQYFQNAFLAGTLYIDVANDTVVPTKPPVEILPFAQSGLSPVRDFAHFADLARRYWKAEVAPNHLLPELAPYYPVLVAIPGVGLRLEADSAYMVALTHSQAFAPSRAFLANSPMPDASWAALSSALRPAMAERLASNPEVGRSAALTACDRAAQAHEPHALLTSEWRAHLGRQVAGVNAVLQRLHLGETHRAH